MRCGDHKANWRIIWGVAPPTAAMGWAGFKTLLTQYYNTISFKPQIKRLF